jgi:pimeloyl-ACP methyl ester carboxylesterase
VASVDETLGEDDYDEFGLLHENAAEWDLPFDDPPAVARHRFERADGQGVSYLRWGEGEPELVFLHGGAQNAHTWDTVLLALGRPAVAIDLPGHGHSDRRPDRDYGPRRNAEAVAEVIDAVAPRATVVVGMSLGGATTIRLAATRPDLCRRVVIVDVTPQTGDSFQTMSAVDQGSVALVAGPPTYDTFEEMAEAAIALSPFRAASGVRRGVRHNAVRQDDGRWTWRYDLFGPRTGDTSWSDQLSSLWDDLGGIVAPLLLVRGGESRFVRDEDVDELRRRLPAARVEVVAGAGHAVQSDRPLELVRLISELGAADPS